MKKFSCIFAISVALVGFSGAAVTMSYQVAWNPAVDAGTVGVFVVDTNNDGFTGPLPTVSGEAALKSGDLAVGTFFGADDLILDRTTAADIGGVIGFAGSVNQLLLENGIDPGDPLALYWFDDPTSDPLVNGQAGGWYRSDEVDLLSGSEGAFVIPDDGATVFIGAFGQDFGGGVPDSDFVANNFVVIPEPQTGVLLVFSIAALALRRRRRV